MFLISILILLWIILSGHFDILPLAPGLIFMVLSFFIFQKAKKASKFQGFFTIKPLEFFFYTFYMLKEIFISNLFVANAILKNKTNPQFFSIPNTFKTHSGVTIFANSVTLTPGTIVLKVNENEFIIHALSPKIKNGSLEMKMYNKVLQLEKLSKKE